MIKVLFVCLGNICRSPLAEGIFQHQIRKAGLEKNIVAESAGTSGWNIGERPDHRSIEVARENGIALESLGRKAISSDFHEFDYIIAMDKNNFADLKNLPGSTKTGAAKLYLMRDFDKVGNGQDVPDPYYGDDDGFKKVFEMLERSCRNLLDEIKEKHLL